MTTRCTRIGSCLVGVAAAAGLAWSPPSAQADTLRGALVQAYQNNPQLNSQRAAVRATDETVPQALSGYRPRISLSAQVGEAFLDTTTKSVSSTGVVSYPRTIGHNAIQTYGATYTQTLLDGYGTKSRTQQA